MSAVRVSVASISTAPSQAGMSVRRSRPARSASIRRHTVIKATMVCGQCSCTTRAAASVVISGVGLRDSDLSQQSTIALSNLATQEAIASYIAVGTACSKNRLYELMAGDVWQEAWGHEVVNGLTQVAASFRRAAQLEGQRVQQMAAIKGAEWEAEMARLATLTASQLNEEAGLVGLAALPPIQEGPGYTASVEAYLQAAAEAAEAASSSMAIVRDAHNSSWELAEHVEDLNRSLADASGRRTVTTYEKVACDIDTAVAKTMLGLVWAKQITHIADVRSGLVH